MSKLNPSAVICEVMNEDGRMARYNDLIKFSKKHKLRIASIEDLISYRLKNEKLITNVSNKNINISKYGKFNIKLYKSKLDDSEHYSIIEGKINSKKPIRVRVISTNIINNIINFNKNILNKSLKYLSKFNNYVLIIIKDQNLGTEFINGNKKNNNILRYYGTGAQIIKDLKIKNMILVSRSKKKIIGLEGYGNKITKQEIIK